MKMESRNYLLLTATSMINKPAGLYGLLNINWKEDWLAGVKEILYIDEYRGVKEKMEEVNESEVLDATAEGRWEHILHPTSYQRVSL